MHSWRVLILPYLGRMDVYDAYDFDEPWNGPNNRKLANITISAFDCPADIRASSTITNCLAVVGPDTAWPGSESTSLADFAYERGNILHVVEVSYPGIHWMEPRDLQVSQMAPTVNSTAGRGISSAHPGGAHAAFVDGSVRFVPENTSAEELRAMLNRSGGGSVNLGGF
jgi:prepilin-type processing-associated H-X9-DG protein